MKSVVLQIILSIVTLRGQTFVQENGKCSGMYNFVDF